MPTIHPSHRSETRAALRALVLLGAACLALFWLPLPQFADWPQFDLKFRLALDMVAVCLAALIFAIVWSAPAGSAPRGAQLLASAFLGVALLDGLHLLLTATVPGYDSANLYALDFSLASRLVAALAMLYAVWQPWSQRPLSRKARWHAAMLALASSVAMLGLVLLFGTGLRWPAFFEQGADAIGPAMHQRWVLGLLLVLLVLGALRLLSLLRQPRRFNASGFLGATLALLANSALLLHGTGSTDPYLISGYAFKLLAYGFLYQALFAETVRAPHRALLARTTELEQARAQLAHDHQQLQAASAQMQQEIAERERAQAERATLVHQLSDLAANVPGVLFTYRHDADGRPHCHYLSQRAEAVCGLAREQLQADIAHLMARLRTRDRVQLLRAMAESERLLDPLHTTFRLPHPERGLRWIEVTAQPHHQPDGGVLWHGYAHDVTRTHTDQEWLRLADKVFEASESGIFVTDARRRLVKVNPAFTDITGYAPAEVLGRSPKLLGSGQHDPQFFARMIDTLAHQGRWQGEVWNRRRSGELYAQWLAASCIRNTAGEITHYLAVFTDISGLKVHEQQLDHLANHDMLTGLPNRRLLRDRLQQAIAYSQRNGSGLAVAMLDLDGFKPVNDAHGHAVGDKLLTEVALRLREVVRADETVARLGGDEFVLLFRENHGPLPLERVPQVVQEPMRIKDLRLRVGASIGVTRLRADNAHVAQLLQEADQAMYQAKAAGRNRFEFFDPGATDQPGAGVPEGKGSEGGEGADPGGRSAPNPLAPVPPADPPTPP
ncbi:diguanylate cyclase domain-containing protein [Serpentinimonas maccroryi]|uniref:diguanylate cyclase domain-containing protein n=1 Tax=Serpentinimonas maccroryi TaxID=1458426 RepID=UPI002033239F|nr:diguanylate cyclase [Serpentinimonas maccroryi]MCM2480140.1 diguanylate cyclase [Serpentinimonas maccroryi]